MAIRGGSSPKGLWPDCMYFHVHAYKLVGILAIPFKVTGEVLHVTSLELQLLSFYSAICIGNTTVREGIKEKYRAYLMNVV